MIDELFIYDRDDSVFKDIVAQIPSIATYHVSPNYGLSTNADNLQQYFKDAGRGIIPVEIKYPICICTTPFSRPTTLNGSRWEEFTFTLYFLQRAHYDGQNQLRKPDEDTNTSQALVWEDWSEMKSSAMSFIDLFSATLKGIVTLDGEDVRFKTILNLGDVKTIRRLSNFLNDNLSGVELIFTAFLNTNECIVTTDGVIYDVARFEQEKDPIWEFEKGNYFTKIEIAALLAGITGGLLEFTFSQSAPVQDWIIDYPDQYIGYPAVNVTDSLGRPILILPKFNSNKQLELNFGRPTSGLAFLTF